MTDKGRKVGRDAYLLSLWRKFGKRGLLGIHEGTLLSEEAASEGIAVESWAVDAGEAPRERDWVGDRELVRCDLYFESERGAREAAEEIRAGFLEGAWVVDVASEPDRDWNAEWKASFTGVEVPPDWIVLPPWVEMGIDPGRPGRRVLRLNPGAGFGTGTHETTQLCLEALAGVLDRVPDATVLDFGSGSGILAIGAALRGASAVDAVEIDELALHNGRENARLNGVEARIRFARDLGDRGPYAVVVANILKPVLLAFAAELVERLEPRGTLILSGLMEGDVPAVRESYETLLAGRPASQDFVLGEWRAIVFRKGEECP